MDVEDKTYSRKVVSVVEPIPDKMNRRDAEGASTRREFNGATNGNPDIGKYGLHLGVIVAVWRFDLGWKV